ncbi:PSD1 and planctomycete cytochrome C domain-containing protein [Roseibacillus ishigakijimensis]|uniref:PSD1 domain-containing protein n=1 Tax=Roseibacillus ishigakijimensis TaxID=454146 RepID=A0A934RQY1_9BACT|nr:PSD1 and planctomycete cytochrome C domain-containing protein [Roseibacillus ishigakijimensis]MBK1832911.1 PSD1 domain-containing protein [Roseibacillus ishigakijimensis]
MRVVLFFQFLLLVRVSAEAFSAADLEFFEREVRPVLAESCYSCHSAEAKKLKAGLWLDSRASILSGGDTGPAIVPGDPDASLLIETVRYNNVDLEMPPKSKLPDAAIAALEKWVAIGAPWPDEPDDGVKRAGGFDLEGRRDEHWSWHGPEERELPSVEQRDWPQGPIDHFILARLEEAGLKPAPDADRRSWLRRVSFDLTGLPPTAQEVADFLADSSPEAHAKVVDRLLASPRFGEKWARHWLDLMRYADSYGHEFDYPIPHAWRYRDYVVRAFNEDLPYDQFLVEHVAGDLVEPRVEEGSGLNEAIVATTSWWLGEANHAPTDVRGDEALRIDNQIDVFSKTFLGLTVSCARCHDHKFDAISTKDFYALAGFLQSSRRREAYHDPDGRLSQGLSRLQDLQREAAGLLSESTGGGVEEPSPGAEVIESFAQGVPADWFVSGPAFQPGSQGPAAEATVALADEERPLVPAGVVHSGLFGKKQQGVLQSPTFELTEPEIHIRLAATGPVRVRAVIDGYFMTEYHQLLFKGTNLDSGQANTKGAFAWKTLGGDLRKYVGHRIYLEFADLGNGYLAIDEIAYRRSEKPEFTQQAEAGLKEALQPIFTEAAEVEQSLPAPVVTLALQEGTPENEFVHIRGGHKSLGDEVPRRNLTALGEEAFTVPPGASGRLQLAQSLIAEDHPLTARVYVNRLWHYLTGVGLVASVDDFGVMGEEPSHPALLDWLARDFIAQGWSSKAMIRQIVLSRTYRQGVVAAEENSADLIAQADPNNRLLHHFRVRRLPAEGVRDAILAVSGSLSDQHGGPSVLVHLTPFLSGRGKPESGPLDLDGRRSLYLAIRRNFLSPFEHAFDRPIPFTTIGRRTSSNVPAQSLTLMNDPFVLEEARRWARTLLALPASEERLESAYLAAFSRSPSAEERDLLRQFLSSQQEHYQAGPDDEQLWTDLCHLLINQKEFIYLK